CAPSDETWNSRAVPVPHGPGHTTASGPGGGMAYQPPRVLDLLGSRDRVPARFRAPRRALWLACWPHRHHDLVGDRARDLGAGGHGPAWWPRHGDPRRGDDPFRGPGGGRPRCVPEDRRTLHL